MSSWEPFKSFFFQIWLWFDKLKNKKHFVSFRFIGSVRQALGLRTEGTNRVAMMASLDHSMFFYDQ